MADRIKKLKREDKRIPKNTSTPTDGPRRLSVGIVGIRKTRKSSLKSDGSSGARARNPFSDLVPTANRSSVSVLTKVNTQTGETTHLRRKSKAVPMMRSSRKESSVARPEQQAHLNELLSKAQAQLSRPEISPTSTSNQEGEIPIALIRPSKQKLEKLKTISQDQEKIVSEPRETPRETSSPIPDVSRSIQRQSLEDGFVKTDSDKAIEDMAMDKIDRFLESLGDAPTTNATVIEHVPGINAASEERDTARVASLPITTTQATLPVQHSQKDERNLSNSSWSTNADEIPEGITTLDQSEVKSDKSDSTPVKPLFVTKATSSQGSVPTKSPTLSTEGRETFKGVDAAWLTEMYKEYISQHTASAPETAEIPVIADPALRPLILPAVIGEVEKGSVAERLVVPIVRTPSPKLGTKIESPMKLKFGSARDRSPTSLASVALSPRSELPNPLQTLPAVSTQQTRPPPINLASRPVLARTNTALSQQEAVQIAKAKLELASEEQLPVTSSDKPTFKLPETKSYKDVDEQASTVSLAKVSEQPRAKPKLKSNLSSKAVAQTKNSTMPQFTGSVPFDNYDIPQQASASVQKNETDLKAPARTSGKAASIRSTKSNRTEDRKPIVSNNVSFFDPFCGDTQSGTPSAYVPKGDDTISPSDAKSISEIRAASIIALAQKTSQDPPNTKRSSKHVVETAQTKRANTTPLLAALEYLDGRSDDEDTSIRPAEKLVREPSVDPFDAVDEALLAYPVPPKFKQTAKQQEMLGMEPAQETSKLTKTISRASKSGSISSDDDLLPKLRKRSSGFGVSMKASKLLGMSANVKKFAASQKAKKRDLGAELAQPDDRSQHKANSANPKSVSSSDKPTKQIPNRLDLSKTADYGALGIARPSPGLKSGSSGKTNNSLFTEPPSPISPTSIRPPMRGSASFSRSFRSQKPLLESLSEIETQTPITMEEVLGLPMKPKVVERSALSEAELPKDGFKPQPERFGVSGHFSIAQREASFSKARGKPIVMPDAQLSSTAPSMDGPIPRPVLSKTPTRTSFTGYDMRQAPTQPIVEQQVAPAIAKDPASRSPNMASESYVRRASSVYSASRYASQSRSVASNSPEIDRSAVFQSEPRPTAIKRASKISQSPEVEAALAKDTSAKLSQNAFADPRGRQNFNAEMLGSSRSSVRSRSRSTSPGTTSQADGTEISTFSNRAPSMERSSNSHIDSFLHDPDVSRRTRPSNKRLTTLDRINQTATGARTRSPATSVKSATSVEHTKHVHSGSANSNSGSVPISYYAPKNKANVDPFRNLGLPVITAGKVMALEPSQQNEEPAVVRSYTRSARGSITSVSSRASNEAQYQAKPTDGNKDIMAPRSVSSTYQAPTSTRSESTQKPARPVGALVPRSSAEAVPKSRPASMVTKKSDTFDIRRALAKSEDGANTDEEEDFSPFFRPSKQNTTEENDEASLGALATTATQALSKWFA